MLIVYGHPFSSYTWKVLIALYANEADFEFRIVDADHPDHREFVQINSPMGKFPVLVDGDNVLFESSTIIEYIGKHHTGQEMLVPENTDAAIGIRMVDRVFDNYVMTPTTAIVMEHIRNANAPDQARIEEAKAQLQRAYHWIEGWLQYYPPLGHVSLIECSAAPALFYADWVHPIGDEFPRLRRWRAFLLNLRSVARCVDEARPYRAFFPPGAPDRD